ncbi:hypothetical protein [Lentzea sp. NEAU-D7]|uniref:hypothetical protein n=1 Tax=Lentzea sp. NEAU-D7 TaxID=2994667 RepID=UPI00224AA270|nr:hypothetical protein [Lentzea sp. NEAU-D7]MCX2949974.1 hypothetical protein [Lentzea sp. NEAU-D7]
MTTDLVRVALPAGGLGVHLAELKRRWWTLHYVPDAENPVVIAGAYWHEDFVDVVQIFGPVESIAYRAPMRPGWDAFRPRSLVWSFKGEPNWSIRNVLLLHDPEEPLAPRIEASPLPECQILPQLLRHHGTFVVESPRQPPRVMTVPPPAQPLPELGEPRA